MLRAFFRLSNGINDLKGIAVGNGDLVCTDHCGFFADKHLPPAAIYAIIGCFAVGGVEIQAKFAVFTHDDILIYQNLTQIFFFRCTGKYLFAISSTGC